MPKNLQVLNATAISNKECQEKQPNVVHDSHLCTIAPPGQGICSVSISKVMHQNMFSKNDVV